MGDISEIRGLVVIGTFISVMVFLTLWIPPNLYVLSEDENRKLDVPEYFDSVDILSYADNYNFTLDDSGDYDKTFCWRYDFTLGGHNLQFKDFDLNSPPYVTLERYWILFGFLKMDIHSAEWFFNGLSRGDENQLSGTELNNDYTEGTIDYIAKVDGYQFHVFFAFNETEYDHPLQAWNNNELYVLIAIEFDQINTSYNAWNLISGVLFFGLPNVNWMLDILIHIPIWIAEIYLIYILVLRTIGAIFGGGA